MVLTLSMQAESVITTILPLLGKFLRLLSIPMVGAYYSIMSILVSICSSEYDKSFFFKTEADSSVNFALIKYPFFGNYIISVPESITICFLSK